MKIYFLEHCFLFPKPYYLATYFQSLTLSNFPITQYNGLDKSPIYTMDFFFSQPENTTYCMQCQIDTTSS